MGKAEKLLILKENGFNVPKFIYIKGLDYELPFKVDRYIVRSSFSLEDSEKSFAGIFKSYGSLKEEEIGKYLRNVLSGSEEAKIYSKKSKINKEIKPGAIIQEYIISDKGGVCFTNYNANIVIEVSKSPALVTSGTEKNEVYKIPRFSLDINNKPAFIKNLVADALDIEAIFNKPQDIEWLYAKNKIYILQTRDAEYGASKNWSSIQEFLSIIPPTSWDRYLAFSYIDNPGFRRVSYELTNRILDLKIFDWKRIMRRAYRKPKGKDPIEAFKEAIINYGYYGLLNQLTEDNSIAMKRVDLSAKRLQISKEQLLDYAIWRRKSVYKKIIGNPKKYEETFTEDIDYNKLNPKIIDKKSVQYKFSKREKKLAEFFAMLYDIKVNGVVYHDYYISPILQEAYCNLPNNMKGKIKDYVEIFELQGFKLPKLDREEQRKRSYYQLHQSIEGVVGKDIVVYRDVPPEAVLKFQKIKCIISEEGGMLSHAAILSREFDISFIAGIKDVTKLLMVGDKLKIEPNDNYINIRNLSRKTKIKVGTK